MNEFTAKDRTRCGTCSRWPSRRCVLCGGDPDPDVGIEDVLRWVVAVDRATGGYGSADVVPVKVNGGGGS